MVDSPQGSLHFQQEGGVVFLVVGQFPTGVADGVVVAVLVDLGEDGPESSGAVLLTNAGIRGQRVFPSFSGVSQHWLADQREFELLEGFQGLVR